MKLGLDCRLVTFCAGGLAVTPQQMPMANAGHGPMQGRPTQGNNQVSPIGRDFRLTADLDMLR